MRSWTAATLTSSDTFSSERDDHELGLRVVVQSFHTLLAAETTVLETAERPFEQACLPPVDINLPGFELGCDTMCTSYIPGPDAGRESEFAVVGQRNRRVLVSRKGNHNKDGAEDLLPCDPHVVGDTGVDGRFDQPVFARRAPTDGQRGSVLGGDVEVVQHLVELVLGRDRAVALPGYDRFQRDFQRFHELVVNLLRDQQSGSARTDLPGECREGFDRARHRCIEVSVGKYDVRRLSAELERHRNESFSGDLADLTPSPDRPRKRDLANARMLDQRTTGPGAHPGHDVEHTGRCSRISSDPGQLKCRRRGELRRLANYDIPGSERGRDSPCGLEERTVPWSDDSDNAEGLPSGICVERGH